MEYIRSVTKRLSVDSYVIYNRLFLSKSVEPSHRLVIFDNEVEYTPGDVLVLGNFRLFEEFEYYGRVYVNLRFVRNDLERSINSLGIDMGWVECKDGRIELVLGNEKLDRYLNGYYIGIDNGFVENQLVEICLYISSDLEFFNIIYNKLEILVEYDVFKLCKY
jgi:hypothetical protein